jgi:hypothetical protein
MRRLLFLAALLGAVALTSGCEEKKSTANGAGKGGLTITNPAAPAPK